MKFCLSVLLFLVFGVTAVAQETKPSASIYNPKADARQDIKRAVAKAKKEKKHVLLQIGGNWCIWCRRFHELVTTNDTLKDLLDKNFIILHINYSPENKNEEVLESLEYPQRFGFPVFVILNGEGERIHTQNSAYLEEGKGYSHQKVTEFLEQWSPKALNPTTYQHSSK